MCLYPAGTLAVTNFVVIELWQLGLETGAVCRIDHDMVWEIFGIESERSFK